MQIQAENTASVTAETVEAKAQLQVALARIAELEAALRFANEYVGRLALTLAEKVTPGLALLSTAWFQVILYTLLFVKSGSPLKFCLEDR